MLWYNKQKGKAILEKNNEVQHLLEKMGLNIQSGVLSEEVEFAMIAFLKYGRPLELVVGPNMSSKDFYVLAKLCEISPKLVHVYFRPISPEFHSGKVGKNLYFNNSGNTITKVIENISNEMAEKYKELFEKYKKMASSVAPQDLRRIAKIKEKEERSVKNQGLTH